MNLKNKVYLVILKTHGKHDHFLEESHEEMRELAQSAGFVVVGHTEGVVKHPSPSHFLRKGKLDEIYLGAKKAKANRFIFNVDLTPAQARNIKALTKIESMDRTGLILNIFGKRAKTKAGKLQVELARLNYILPRLGGLGTVMSRLGGGIGSRGPGEQELEWDRRKIRKRIQRVKEELKKVRKHRELIHSSRKKKNLTTIALVGYTNAGKSTLLNALTGSDTYVADKLFATLDPKARMQNVNGRRDVLFVDTVGFLRDLPHTLVESFHATLEGVAEADALLHVLDASHMLAEEFKVATEKVLEEIQASEIPRLLVLNKADLLSKEDMNKVELKWPQGVLVSAKKREGVHSLLSKLSEKIASDRMPEDYDAPEESSNAS